MFCSEKLGFLRYDIIRFNEHALVESRGLQYLQYNAYNFLT